MNLDDRLNGLRAIAEPLINLLCELNTCDHEQRDKKFQWSKPGHAGDTFQSAVQTLITAIKVQFPELEFVETGSVDLKSLQDKFFETDICWDNLKNIIKEHLAQQGYYLQWSFLFKVPGCHTWHKDQFGRVAVADDSGTTPTDTDDGVLWLDTTSPIVIRNRYSSNHEWVEEIKVPLFNFKRQRVWLGGTSRQEVRKLKENFEVEVINETSY